MYPITHIWFAEKVLGYRNNSVVLGAIFPDIAITRCLNYTDTHYCGFKLYNHLEDCCGDFAKAMITHVVKPMGLDYYGDESFMSGHKGYCFQKGQQIVGQVIEACNLPEVFGLWKAHNFIEMGIELIINERHPELVLELHKAFGDKDAISHAAKPIEEYYGLRDGLIIESFGSYAEYIEFDQLSSHSLAVKYDMQMQSKHGISIDVEKSGELIQRCKAIVQNDLDSFMDYCCTKVKALLEGGDEH
jgi:hypothetical protein